MTLTPSSITDLGNEFSPPPKTKTPKRVTIDTLDIRFQYPDPRSLEGGTDSTVPMGDPGHQYP